MTLDLHPPSVVFRGRFWGADELTELAARWRQPVHDSESPLVAVVMTNHPQAVAAFFAAFRGSRPLIVLPPTPSAWRAEPPLPKATQLVLPPVLAELAPAAEALGLRPMALPEPAAAMSLGTAVRSSVTSPGLVLFTSGSTGAPKPVYRTADQVVGSARLIFDLLGVPRGSWVAGTLPLFTTHGVSCLLGTAERAGILGLLERFEPAAALTLFASHPFHYWPGVPVMAQMLARLARQRSLRRSHVPPICSVAGASLSEETGRAFREEFAVSLRVIYGSTEAGMVSMDDLSEEPRWDGGARVAPGVEVSIGDDPRAPVTSGQPGRIWIRSPFYMEGYGYPPTLARPDGLDGWWPMADRGRLSDDRRLAVLGRVDDAFKTRAGFLVEPAAIIATLLACPGVADAAVVPVASPAGVVPGALVESAFTIEVSELRSRLAARLPWWCQPVVLRVVDALPRLATGKVDHERCAAMLHASLG